MAGAAEASGEEFRGNLQGVRGDFNDVNNEQLLSESTEYQCV